MILLGRFYRARWVVLSAFLTLLGLCEVGCAILWVEWRTVEASTSPLMEMEDMSVTVNGGAPQPLTHSIFVHRGDALNVLRVVKSSQNVNAQIERVFNTGDPAKSIDLPIISQRFPPGITVMAPQVLVPEDALLWQLYRYEVIAFDFYHAPKVFNDFAICVVPAEVKPPEVRTPCVAPEGDLK